MRPGVLLTRHATVHDHLIVRLWSQKNARARNITTLLRALSLLRCRGGVVGELT